MRLITKWTDGERAAPEPLEGNIVATVVTGTLLWLALFLGQLPFYGWYADGGHQWWIWTCAAGAGLGVIGLWYVRRREAAIQRAAASSAASTGTSTDAASTGAPADPES